jgi:transcriptional regulator with XRE-family HTH domain
VSSKGTVFSYQIGHNMNYSKAIRVARSLADLSQGELADRAEIDRSYLSLIESGKRQPSVETIEKIAVALKLPFHLLSLLGSEEADKQKADPRQIESLSLALTKLLLQAESHEPPTPAPSSAPRTPPARSGTSKKPSRAGIHSRGRTRSVAGTR